MKNLIYLFGLFCLIGCNLDLPIEDEITGMDAIDNVDIANEALSRAYLNFPKSKVVFSLLSDDFYPNSNIFLNKDMYKLYNWNPNEISIISADLWRRYYKTIHNTNVILQRIPTIIPQNENEVKKLRYIHAQTLALKAYVYLELLNYYSPSKPTDRNTSLGIILKDHIAAEEKARATWDESYIATEALLLQSLDLFNNIEEVDVYHLSRQSVLALLAKLYLNWGKNQLCIEACNQLIENNSFNPDAYKNAWQNPDNNPEVLLAFEYNSLLFSPYVFDSNMQNNIFYINRNIDFMPNDIRGEVTLLPSKYRNYKNEIIDVYYLGKYRKNIDANVQINNILMLRMSEIYFLKAEALYHNGRIDEAREILNRYLEQRNIKIEIPDNSDFLEFLIKEKQKEFIGEGLRYTDLKRNHKNLIRVDYTENQQRAVIHENDYRWLLPIPFVEIQENANVKQNPKWGLYIQ